MLTSKFPKTSNFLDQGMAFSFYALIFFLPISIALVEIFGSLALLFFILKRIFVYSGILSEKKNSLYENIRAIPKVFKPVKSILNWPILFYLAFNLLSVFTGQYYSESIKGFLGKVLQNAFIYFTFIEAVNSKRRLKIFLSVFFASFSLICINGIYQHFMGTGFIRGNPELDGRICSSLRQANDFGGYLLLGIPALGSLLIYFYNSRKNRFAPDILPARSIMPVLISLIVLVLSIACLGFTFSRGAWLAFSSCLIIASMYKFEYFVYSNLFILLFIFIFSPLISFFPCKLKPNDS